MNPYAALCRSVLPAGLLCAFSAQAAAQDAAPVKPDQQTVPIAAPGEADKAKDEAETGDNAGQTFGGISFGGGVAVIFGSSDRVSSASVVNGIVRVSEVDNVRAGVMLEMHHFFTPYGGSFIFRAQNPTIFVESSKRCSIKSPCADGKTTGTGIEYLAEADRTRAMWGHGPFIGLQPGTSNIVETIGAGWMIGFRQTRTKSNSFNIGVGYAYRLRTQVLGDGIVENEPLPVGETQVRFKNVGKGGVFLIASGSF